MGGRNEPGWLMIDPLTGPWPQVRQQLTHQQRFRSYAAQPAEKLNADQKSAISSLPILEAQSRELEDLIKPGGAVEVSVTS